jgi:beta-glucosidase/6-phospho-beta-glucosidase/beta-galactosidase
MKNVGIDFYRFSLSWARILPTGNLPVNQAGIDHYNKIIDLLLENGIEPFVTLYHWDLPQALDSEIGGWLGTEISDRFALYANIAFQSFGDRVKKWLTFNEVIFLQMKPQRENPLQPLSVCILGYDGGVNAPGRCSGSIDINISNSE